MSDTTLAPKSRRDALLARMRESQRASDERALLIADKLAATQAALDAQSSRINTIVTTFNTTRAEFSSEIASIKDTFNTEALGFTKKLDDTTLTVAEMKAKLDETNARLAETNARFAKFEATKMTQPATAGKWIPTAADLKRMKQEPCNNQSCTRGNTCWRSHAHKATPDEATKAFEAGRAAARQEMMFAVQQAQQAPHAQQAQQAQQAPHAPQAKPAYPPTSSGFQFVPPPFKGFQS